MKLCELTPGDKLPCLRIRTSTGEITVINLRIYPISRWMFRAESEKFDTYMFYRSPESDISGLRICLDTGSEDQDFNEFSEFLFTNMPDLKNFAIEYCRNKIKEYEQNIQTIKDW